MQKQYKPFTIHKIGKQQEQQNEWKKKGWVNPLKEKFVTKIFFSDVEWSSENLWKMISADVKANKNNKK